MRTAFNGRYVLVHMIQYSWAAMLLVFSILLSSSSALAEDELSSTESPAYWDYGVGFGGVRFEHYPASDQNRIVALPFPTFQYRGKILRADDREGAHLYLYKGTHFKLEISGHGDPALKSDDNTARKGMEDLPWLGAVGPKLVARPTDGLEFSLNAYQAIATDFVMTRSMGSIFEARASYSWNTPFAAFGPFKESGYRDSKWIFSVRGGSRDYLALYFEVPEKYATTERPMYDAREGLLNYNVTYFQSIKSGRVSLYAGGGLHSYAISANRQSPLHKADYSWTALLGINYRLGESARPEVPESETSTIFENLRRNRQLQKDF